MPRRAQPFHGSTPTLPLMTKFVKAGFAPLSSGDIAALKELLRIVTFEFTPENATVVPFAWPVVPTGAANQLFSSVTPADRAGVGLQEDVVDRVAVELRVAHGHVRPDENRQALDVAGVEVVGLDVVDAGAVDEDVRRLRPELRRMLLLEPP